MRAFARADPMLAWRLLVSGRVQGVGYRMAMVEAATALGVAGWVRNRGDGTVEAVVQGDEVAVDRLLTWCRRGPSAARVTAVSTQALAVDPTLDAFEARRTEL
jgi:acylphosphatase